MSDWLELVESRLTGILFFENGKRIEIFFDLPSKQRCRIIMMNVDRFLMNEMREKNIVEKAHTWDRSDGKGRLKSAILMLVTGSENDDCDEAFTPVIQSAIEKVESGENILLEIDSVYGAEILALATSATLVIEDGSA